MAYFDIKIHVMHNFKWLILVSHRVSGSCPGDVMSDLWWTVCQWITLSSEFFFLSLCHSLTHQFSTHPRPPEVLGIDITSLCRCIRRLFLLWPSTWMITEWQVQAKLCLHTPWRHTGRWEWNYSFMHPQSWTYSKVNGQLHNLAFILS